MNCMQLAHITSETSHGPCREPGNARVSAGTREPRPDKDEFGGHGEVGIHCCRTISGGPRPKPPRSAWVVRSTVAGRKAQEIRRPLFGVIEKRWQERFGKDEIDELREALGAVVGQLDFELPDCLPILGYGLFSRGPDYKQTASAPREEGEGKPLSALLSQLRLAFALEFESESELSLAISTNVVRVLDAKGVRVWDHPLLTGVSKEAIAMSFSFVTRRGFAVVGADATDLPTKVARLTPKGRKAQEACRHLDRD